MRRDTTKRGKIKRLNLWRSYSDMMCGLLLLFVLVMTVALFNANQEYHQKVDTGGITSVVNDIYSQELTQQATTISDQKDEISAMKNSLQEVQATVTEQLIEMEDLRKDLAGLTDKLALKETELEQLEISLNAKEQNLNAIRTQLQEAQDQISSLIGVQSTLVEELRLSLKDSGINVEIDPKTGALVLDSNVLFAFGSAELAEEGKELLAQVMPVYLGVLLSDQFFDRMSELRVNGYTDNVGTYETNLILSQERAASVALYILSLPDEVMPEELKEKLRNKLGVIGHSYANLIMNDDGTINDEASRRVEITFSLVDEDMISSLSDALDNSEKTIKEIDKSIEEDRNSINAANDSLTESTEMDAEGILEKSENVQNQAESEQSKVNQFLTDETELAVEDVPLAESPIEENSLEENPSDSVES